MMKTSSILLLCCFLLSACLITVEAGRAARSCPRSRRRNACIRNPRGCTWSRGECFKTATALDAQVIKRVPGLPTSIARDSKSGWWFANSFAADPSSPPTFMRLYMFRTDSDQPASMLYNWGIRNFRPAEGAGPLGIALDPEYNEDGSRYLYAYLAGRAKEGGGGGFSNQIVRLTISFAGNTPSASGYTVIFSTNNQPGLENGGIIRFHGKNVMYVTVGQGDQATHVGLSQDLSSHAGKILRINKDGSIPANSPMGNEIWAWGIRNSYGIAFDPVFPKRRAIWESENGDNCNDEMNLVPGGVNLGWGPKSAAADCSDLENSPKNTNADNENNKKVRMPRYFWPFPNPTSENRPPSPTGVGFCRGCGLKNGQNRMFVALFNRGTIVSFKLQGKQRQSLAGRTLVYAGTPPFPITTLDAIDGEIYFADVTGAIKKLVNAP